jgi:hypothetical protein
MASREVTVELSERGVIHGRGVQTVTWLVKDRDLWCKAADLQGATLTSLDSGPGTVWERRIELRLCVGTLLERVTSQPEAETKRDVLTHLQRGKKSGRATHRHRYRVGPRGELQRDDGD